MTLFELLPQISQSVAIVLLVVILVVATEKFLEKIWPKKEGGTEKQLETMNTNHLTHIQNSLQTIVDQNKQIIEVGIRNNQQHDQQIQLLGEIKGTVQK